MELPVSDTATAPARAEMASPITWVSSRVARDVIGGTEKTLLRLVESGRIRARKYEGGARHFALADCLAVGQAADAAIAKAGAPR